MISRYHGSSRKEQPYAEQPSSSSHPQDAPHNAQHRSFQSSSAFQFDFPLANEELAAIKAADSLAPRRSDACMCSFLSVILCRHPLTDLFSSSVDFGLSAFSDPNRDSNNNNIYPGHHPYEPTRLQILPQSHASEYPPPTYIPSTASNIPSGTFAFPSSSASRSLSPRDHTGWPEPSSPLSLGPHDGATNSPTDLAFDTQLSHIAFPVDLHPSQPSLQNLPPSRPRENTRLRVANGLDSPSSHSSQRNSEPPCVKLGPNGLAADQPPTAQGKMRTRVYVACLQWFVISAGFYPSYSQWFFLAAHGKFDVMVQNQNVRNARGDRASVIMTLRPSGEVPTRSLEQGSERAKRRKSLFRKRHSRNRIRQSVRLTGRTSPRPTPLVAYIESVEGPVAPTPHRLVPVMQKI